jgi:hypothetical protein
MCATSHSSATTTASNSTVECRFETTLRHLGRPNADQRASHAQRRVLTSTIAPSFPCFPTVSSKYCSNNSRNGNAGSLVPSVRMRRAVQALRSISQAAIGAHGGTARGSGRRDDDRCILVIAMASDFAQDPGRNTFAALQALNLAETFCSASTCSPGSERFDLGQRKR